MGATAQNTPAELLVREDVTVRLAQGIGVAVAPSTWLGAYTVWWVAEADAPYTGPATFRALGRSHTTPITTMRSFVSATGTEHSDARILVAALPYAVAHGWTSRPALDLSFSCGPPAFTV